MLGLLASGALLGLAGAEAWAPTTVDFAELLAGRAGAALEGALSREGLVQVAGVPRFAELRSEALRAAHACAASSPEATSQRFADGTLRRTLAASGVGRGLGVVTRASAAAPCEELAERAGRDFRAAIGEAVDAFVAQLDAVLGLGALALLHGDLGGYSSLEQLVASGERLEHFHTYRVPEQAPSAPTLDFHVDQGLFIAFAPAMMVSEAGGPSGGSSTGAFVVRSGDGREVEAALRPDSVVFLLGDGVNQYVNPAHRRSPLRAPEHAFRMPRDTPGWHRVWYGMMQLPPRDALSDEAGMTFGDIREQILLASAGGDGERAALSLGCTRQLVARELAGSACEEDQMSCWMRCMNHTEEVSPEACAAKGQELVCSDAQGNLFQGAHGDHTYRPRCADPAATTTAPAATTTAPAATSRADASTLGGAVIAAVVVAASTASCA